MPISFAEYHDGALEIARCFGRLTEADIVESIAFAFDDGKIARSANRVVTIDPQAELHALDTETLRNVQKKVLEMETRDGRAVRFRSVLVHASPMQKSIMSLYKAIWDGRDLPGAAFCVVASEAEAWQILGCSPLAD